MSAVPKKHLFSVTDWHGMVDHGLVLPETRAELIEGEIIDMASIGSRHAGRVNWLNHCFAPKVVETAVVSVQNPLQLGDFSEPQPDVLILRPDSDFYSNQHPTPPDVLLLIEVSDTSLKHDRTVKVPLYARFGIVEVWLVNLVENCIEVYLNPQPDGYAETVIKSPGEVIVPSQFPNLTVAVTDVLGKF